MNNLKIITEYSPWFTLLCLALAAGYAWFLYEKKSPWNKRINNILSGFRFLLVFLLCFLLVGPLLKYFRNYSEKPIVVFAIDDSQSIAYVTDSVALSDTEDKIAEVERVLIERNMEVYRHSFGGSEDFSFNFPHTNLSKLLNQVQSDYENRNLVSVVLLSDGIYNQGISPVHNQYNFPVHTIGMGDTVPRKDIQIKALYYNRISYQGNKFPIVVEIHNQGFVGESATVLLKQGSNEIARKTITLKKEKGVSETEFYLSSENKGMQHYRVEVIPLKGEFTLQNNIAHAYIDIIEGKEKILLVAPAPHPDIKAIRSALEKKENYELKIYIPGISELKEEKYDLVIFHNIPDNFNTARTVLEKYLKDQTSVLFIAGNQTNLTTFNSVNNLLKISGRPGQMDQVTSIVNEEFEKFGLDAQNKTMIGGYPPVLAPFGEYQLKGNAEVILHQRIGSIRTEKPLLVINNEDNKKTAVLTGEGLWGWRLHEYKETKNYKTFDKLISNLIQYLSSKEDKRRFRFYPVNNEFLLSDQIRFEAETYNEIYERTYGNKIDFKITTEDKTERSYSFVNNQSGSGFEIKGLSPGIYKYVAITTIAGKTEKSSGEFIIKETLLEALNTTADHELLRILSAQTGGLFFKAGETDKLAEFFKTKEAKSVIHTNEELSEVVNIPWIFFLLLILASTEWFVRKYKGGY